MKKIIFCLITLLIFTNIVQAEDLAPNAKSALIMEYSTGQIVYEKNSNEKLPPASMTKVMTLLLTMEAIDNGRIDLDDSVPISEKASSMGGSQMFLEANSNVRLEELIKGASIASANDAAVALAEYVGGSIEQFVTMMNKRAQELNMTNTNYVNPHGLDAENHYTTAHDMAILSRELIKHQQILKYTGTYEDYFNNANGNRTWLVNTNKLVRFYNGVDGLKTGYTDTAGYCLTATALKNNVRYITVVMGEPSSTTRSSETSSMLNYAFNSFKLNTIIDSNQELGLASIEKGTKESSSIYVKNAITELNPLNSNPNNYTYSLKINRLTAPIKKGSTIGTISVMDNEGLVIREEDVTINEDIPKAHLFQIILRNLKTILTGQNLLST